MALDSGVASLRSTNGAKSCTTQEYERTVGEYIANPNFRFNVAGIIFSQLIPTLLVLSKAHSRIIMCFYGLLTVLIRYVDHHHTPAGRAEWSALASS